MNLKELISVSLNAIRGQLLRSILTMVSIGIGVFAIVCSSGVIGTFQTAISTTMANMGENSLLIQRTPTMTFGNNWRKYFKRKPITFMLAQELRRRMTLTDRISISNTAPAYKIKYMQESTNNDVSVIGIDQNYFDVYVAGITEGRPITESDVQLSSSVAIIGNDVVKTLFPSVSPIGKKITIKNQSFTVVGILESKGAVMGQSQDNRVLIPISLFVKYYTWVWDASVDIGIRAHNKALVQPTADEATGVMRLLRNVKPYEENDFELDTNDALSASFAQFTGSIGIVAWICGLGALFAAGIGIMNMMLVSVRERTREIGIRMALGAKRSWISVQFLIESVTLCMLGAMCGMLPALGIVGLSSMLFSTAGGPLPFTFPWFAVIFSIVACTLIGLGFGIYPAYRAAKLDPIEALRYE